MAPVTQYVFAAMRSKTEHFTAGSHEWLPYSKNAMRTKSPNTNLSPLPSANPRKRVASGGFCIGKAQGLLARVPKFTAVSPCSLVPNS